MGDSANVLRPAASPFIWQNPKSTLHHPLHRPQRRELVFAVMPAPDQVRGFNIRHPVPSQHWIADQVRNDSHSAV